MSANRAIGNEAGPRVAVSIASALACVLALSLAGCGSASSAPSGSGSGGSGDLAKFVIDGRSISVAQSGRTSVRIPQAPELTYSGPLGCKGRYFRTDFVDGLPLFFRYSSRDAYLLIGSDLYYLGGGPQVGGGRLDWDTTSAGHQISVEVNCPPPPPSGPLTGSATPSACTVLTAAIAASALHEKVGRPNFVQENPDLNYCAYRSIDRSFNGDRRVAVSVATAHELASLSSWAQPRISGIGDEAHGGAAGDGLAVRKGKLGIELTVDVGFSADNAADLAAEELVARELLRRL